MLFSRKARFWDPIQAAPLVPLRGNRQKLSFVAKSHLLSSSAQSDEWGRLNDHGKARENTRKHGKDDIPAIFSSHPVVPFCQKMRKLCFSSLRTKRHYRVRGFEHGKHEKTRKTRENTVEGTQFRRPHSYLWKEVSKSSLSCFLAEKALQGAGIEHRKTRENTEKLRKHAQENSHLEHG